MSHQHLPALHLLLGEQPSARAYFSNQLVIVYLAICAPAHVPRGDYLQHSFPDLVIQSGAM